AEAVRVVFDPAVVKFSDLVQVLLTVNNPTTLNQQGADTGTQYRSVIFYQSPAQKSAAEATIKKVGASGMWKSPIVTSVSPYKNFYRAEAYHLNYYEKHSEEGYCRAVIKPKLDKMQSSFAGLLKAKPAVASNRR
ncbi:MAG: peptide-methionine (S)-S-oxide reductase, partial [Armatimonadetes bacterium]|nr:peptide-methionine (S)-S-oxide reductase [Armatimonadota bacterium]